MILPALRGYYTSLGDPPPALPARCGCPEQFSPDPAVRASCPLCRRIAEAPPRQGNYIRIGCQRCGCERVLYHKENCKNRQTRFPAFCLKCGSMIVVEVRMVKGKEVRRAMAPKKNIRPTYQGKKKSKPAPGGVTGGK